MSTGYAVLLSLVVATRGEMEPYIVGSGPANVSQYPHAVLMSMYCVTIEGYSTGWICGSSVVNQMLLVTAAHCVYSCVGRGTKVIINLQRDGRQGGVLTSTTFSIHQGYHPTTFKCDIALMKLNQPMKFNSKLSRVAIMENPPYFERAYVAGWGINDDITHYNSMELKHVEQKVLVHTNCESVLGDLPFGTICASNNKNNHPSSGDSGSGLVVRGYIVIGLVSFNMPYITRDIVVYTDVGYYYKWINSNAARLFCYTRN